MAQGGCHCGAVRYEVEGEPARSGLCHCTDCRRHAGAPMVAWAVFPQDRFRLLQGAPVEYASSEHGRRHFCPSCGTGLFYTNELIFAGVVDIQTATLDDPAAFPPTEQIQVADRIAWMEHAHALPAHERYPEDL
jgi:hypothetical protein